MATVQAILQAAYNRSGRTRNQQLGVEGTELLEVTKRSVRTIFAIAARVNPFYFGKRLSVPFSAGVWTWPTDMELLYRLERGSTEVVIVPVDQRDAEPSKPAVYGIGNQLFGAGGANDPTSGDLVFYYSRRPVDPVATTDSIDPSFPDQHLDAVITELARYLAVKDGRDSDAQAFGDERNAYLRLFLAHMEHATASIERRKYGQVRRFNLDTLFPATAALSGGVAA